MIWIGIFFAVLSILIFCLICFLGDNHYQSGACTGFLLALTVIVASSSIRESISPSITPIDVYRGKTKLEITYRDSVAVDSVVVWKEE